jgi:hypothetical protein
MIISIAFSAGSQTYTHKIDTLGDSIIEEKRDMSLFLNLLPQTAATDIEIICQIYSELDCLIENNSLIMRVNVPENNQYYSLETDYGFPFTKASLKINRIPTNLFDSRINSILQKANLTEGAGNSRPIDLRDKENNLALSNALLDAEIESNYIIIMPNNERSEMNLVTLLSDSKPIEVESYSLNLWLIFLILGIGAVVGLSYSFFGNRRGRR